MTVLYKVVEEKFSPLKPPVQNSHEYGGFKIGFVLYS